MNEFDNIQDVLSGILNDEPPKKEPDKQPATEPEDKQPEPVAAVADTPDELAKQPASDFDLDEALSSIVGGETASDTDEEETQPESSQEPAAAPPQSKPEQSAPQLPDMPVFCTEEIAAETDIRNFGTLATLQTARWHGKKRDRKAELDAAQAAGADAAAFESRKHLLVGCDAKLKAVHKAIDTARTKHYHMTLAWSTVACGDSGTGKRTGGRLLPNTLFMEYMTEMGKCKIEMDQLLDEFEHAYPSLVQQVQNKLGTAFDPSDYPTAGTIRQHFRLDFDFSPVPMSSDFKGLADSQVKRLADAMNRKTQTMLENAMQDAWSRLYKVVSHAHERLSNPDKEFHYTMVDKLRDAAKMLKHLNVTDDPRIEDVRAHVEKHLTMHEVKEIRKDENLRKHLATEARNALDMMEKSNDS